MRVLPSAGRLIIKQRRIVFAMVVDNITVNGTGSILDTGQCAAAGLTMPTGNLPGRGQLVL